MKNKDIYSAVLGGAFFAIPYLGLGLALAPAIVMGASAFGAGELVFSGFKKRETLKDTNKPLYEKISAAKKQNKEILELIPKVEKEETRINLKEISATVNKIIKVIEKDPKKANSVNNFFDYYLPVLIKIVNRYDEIENQQLVSKEGKNFMSKADKMIADTSVAFESILSNLYEDDIEDADADMKVYNLMLKGDGIVDNTLSKGELDEK